VTSKPTKAKATQARPAASVKPGKPAAHAIRINALADLKVVKRAIAEQTEQRISQAHEQVKTVKRVASDKDLFVRAAGAVQRLSDKRQALHQVERKMPLPVPCQREEKAPLIEAISDEFEAAALLDVDELVSYRRPGIGTDVTRKLRHGGWRVQRQLDLHGLRRDEAREQLSLFIHEACEQGIRCVRVIHGKGLSSPGQAPVLKTRVQSWLVQKQEVLAFVQAQPADGGAGALLVLLA